MAEHDEHDPRDDSPPAGGPPAAPAGNEPPAAPVGGGQAPPPPDRPVAPAPPGPGTPPPQGGAQAEFLESGRTPPPYVGGAAPAPYVAGAAPPRGPGRRRRWSSNGAVRAGALALVAGLVGGLVGGGIVAAFDDHGPDRTARFVPRTLDRGDGPGFRFPRRVGPPDGRWGQYHGVPQPGRPGTPAPTPTPKSSG
jgi:hypothetical protein